MVNWFQESQGNSMGEKIAFPTITSITLHILKTLGKKEEIDNFMSINIKIYMK